MKFKNCQKGTLSSVPSERNQSALWGVSDTSFVLQKMLLETQNIWKLNAVFSSKVKLGKKEAAEVVAFSATKHRQVFEVLMSSTKLNYNFLNGLRNFKIL